MGTAAARESAVAFGRRGLLPEDGETRGLPGEKPAVHPERSGLRPGFGTASVNASLRWLCAARAHKTEDARSSSAQPPAEGAVPEATARSPPVLAPTPPSSTRGATRFPCGSYLTPRCPMEAGAPPCEPMSPAPSSSVTAAQMAQGGRACSSSGPCAGPWPREASPSSSGSLTLGGDVGLLSRTLLCVPLPAVPFRSCFSPGKAAHDAQ